MHACKLERAAVAECADYATLTRHGVLVVQVNCLSGCLSDSLTVLLSDCLLVCFSLCLSACLAVRLSVILSACLAFLRDCRGVTAIQLPVHNCRGVSGVVWRRGHTRQVERGRTRGTEGLSLGKGYSSVIVDIVNGL